MKRKQTLLILTLALLIIIYNNNTISPCHTNVISSNRTLNYKTAYFIINNIRCSVIPFTLSCSKYSSDTSNDNVTTRKTIINDYLNGQTTTESNNTNDTNRESTPIDSLSNQVKCDINNINEYIIEPTPVNSINIQNNTAINNTGDSILDSTHNDSNMVEPYPNANNTNDTTNTTDSTSTDDTTNTTDSTSTDDTTSTNDSTNTVSISNTINTTHSGSEISEDECETTIGFYNQSKADEIFALTNEYRTNNGLSPLTVDYSLQDLAKKRSLEIVELFSHTRPNGYEWYTILDDFPCSYLGENLAFGYSYSNNTFNSWIDSQSHLSNIIDMEYNKIGIACYETSTSTYWVQFFSN